LLSAFFWLPFGGITMKLFASLIACGVVYIANVDLAVAEEGPASTTVVSNDDSLAEIVVTSEKKIESAAKAPVAVTVVSGDTLVDLGISNVLLLANVLPSARFNSENTESKLFLRGVGSDFGVPWISESVSTYVNGGLINRFGTTASFFDIEAVEVLPGPQGTLYGKNSVGGTVQIRTKRPSGAAENEASVELGNYGLVHTSAAVGGALGDTFFVRLAINTQHHEGYQSNGDDTESSEAARLSAVWKPNESFDAFVWAQYWQNQFHNAAWQNLPYPDPDHPWYVPPVKPPLAPDLPGQITYQALSDASSKTAGGEFNWHFSKATLTYIPFWTDFFTNEQRPVDGLDLPWKFTLNQRTHELKLSSNDNEKLNWLTGLYYLDSLGNLLYTVGPNLAGYRGYIKQQSYSAYAQITYSVFPWLRETAGVRYSSDHLSAPDSAAISTNGFVTGDFSPIYTPFEFNHTWRRVDWKEGLEADIGAHSLVYGNVQTGYNEGTYNTFPSTPAFSNEVKPQRLLGFTLGTKNRFFDNRLEIDDEVYHYIYKDFLLSTFTTFNGTIEYNAPRAEITGNELTVKYQFTRDDLLTVGAGILKAKIKEFVDYSTLPNSPTYTINLGGQHTFRLPGDAGLVLRVDSLISAGYYALYTHDPYTYQPRYTKTTASLTYTSANGKWDFGLWGRNLENVATLSAAGAGGIPGPAASYIDQPRTYGMQVRARF
jgi:iron complex outermembrane receptor protein